jgi:ABC-2 type transport system ATP-binding protein
VEHPQDSARPVLQVEGLTKSYDGHLAVDGLSFEVHAGEILGLVGPNGAGKTTALRSIVGILPVKTGRVLVCGYDVTLHEAEAKACLTWVPDDPQPFDALTVFEHLEFTAALYGVSGWRERASDLLGRFELIEKRDALGGELSRGMRQKLAFCCAWLPRPRLVLLDEPLSGLDPRGIRSAKQAIRELAAEGTAAILSSHLLDLIEALASRIMILDRGRKVFSGTLAEARQTIGTAEGSSLEAIFMAATDGRQAAPPAEEVFEAGGDWSSRAKERDSA